MLLEARNPIEAIRLKAKRLMVMRRGKVIAETPSSPCSLNLETRRIELDRRFV
jgi:cytosine deaminase